LLAAVAISAALVACSSDADSATQPVPQTGSVEPTVLVPATVPVTGVTDATTPAATDTPSSPATGTSDALPLTAPQGDAFYTPPDPIPGTANGDLIWARPMEQAPLGSAAYQVLYRSENVAGQPIAVSGVVIGPQGSTQTDRPVLTYAHGTTGLGDQCAPSLDYGEGGGETLLAIGAVALGYTFVATDYEGLGTPGVHPFLVGQSEGRGVLDIVRAAGQLAGTGVGADSPVAIFGHSQGGHAALMAGELAATYAPELDVIGIVAGAPPGDVATIERSTAAAGDLVAGGFSLMIDAGYAAAYPDLPVDALVTDDGVAVLDEVGQACTGDAFALAQENPDIQLDPTTDADWVATFDVNSPGAVAPTAPVLIIHGSADTVVPPILSEMIADDYCALGVTVQRIVYDGADHSTVITAALSTVQAWIADRLAGTPAPTSC
jgi:pimeloyl-ACP methyl ester carboxylesterase